MNTIPEELIAIPNWHGYFWHPTEQVVYSLKITGQLRKLKKTTPFTYNNYHYGAGFRLSYNGKSRTKFHI
jgi:hypothetical protein